MERQTLPGARQAWVGWVVRRSRVTLRSAAPLGPSRFRVPSRFVLPMLLPAVLAACCFQLGCGTEKPPSTPDRGTEGVSSERTSRRSQSAGSGRSLAWGDCTEAWGIRATYQSGQAAGLYTMLETLGGGVGIVDVDLNGLPDLIFAGGGQFPSKQEIRGLPLSVWQQRGVGDWCERGAETNLKEPTRYTHGVHIADYDQDGFPDILVAGYGGCDLYHNLGDGSFECVPGPLAETGKWSVCAAWGDFNQDGVHDLFVVNYLQWSLENHRTCLRIDGQGDDVCTPRLFPAESDQLWLGNGDGTFREASLDAGIVDGGKGLGVLATDIDRDGDLDLYVANDTTPNFFYLNEGQGRFLESGTLHGVATDETSRPNGSMGVALGDFDRNGRVDLGVTNYAHENFALYRQREDGLFFHASDATGITSTGKNFVSWGTAFLDVDADADEDLLITSGHILYYPESGNSMPQDFMLLRNDDGRFERQEFARDHYWGKPHYGRGLAIGDLDRRGGPEIVLTNVNEPAAVLSQSAVAGDRYLFVHLVGTDSIRDAIGAIVTLRSPDAVQTRWGFSAGSFASSHERLYCFGLPTAPASQQVEVAWPSGLCERFDALGAGHMILVEGTGVVVEAIGRALSP